MVILRNGHVFVNIDMINTVLKKNKMYANVKGHIEKNSFKIQSKILQNVINKKNSSNPLIQKILNIIKTEKLQNNYIENKTKIIDTCFSES